MRDQESLRENVSGLVRGGNVSEDNVLRGENLGQPVEIHTVGSGDMREFLTATFFKDLDCALIVLEDIQFDLRPLCLVFRSFGVGSDIFRDVGCAALRGPPPASESTDKERETRAGKGCPPRKRYSFFLPLNCLQL